MKKRISILALALCLTTGLTTQAFAAAGDKYTNGVTDKTIIDAEYTLTLQTEADATATAYTGVTSGDTKTVYNGVAKMTLDFAGTADEQYMVFLLSGADTVPTASNLQYIDQIAGTGDDDSFTIYPSALEAGDYTIYVSSTNSEYAEVGSFSVVGSWEEAAYTLGDVDSDGKIAISDAVAVMQHIVALTTLNETQQAAAEVDGSVGLTISDALQIMQYIVGIVQDFE